MANQAKYIPRDLTLQDVPALAAMESMCFALPWTEEQFYAVFRQKAFAASGILQGKMLRAYLSVYCTPEELEILNIAVKPEYRRQGMGEILLERSLQKAKEKGIMRAILEVRPSNAAALALYHKKGFIQIGCRRNYYPDTGEDALILGLDLAQK